jgi:hypothetical protein
MTQEPSAEWEMAIVLPLGVVASQLRRIETQLRQLNMKALGFARERENRALRARVEARLDEIQDSLGSIGALVADIEIDLQPRAKGPTAVRVKDEVVPLGGRAAAGDRRSVHDTAEPEPRSRGSRTDRDD